MLSLIVAGGGCSPAAVLGLLIAVASLVEHGLWGAGAQWSRHVGSVLKLLGSRAQARLLGCMGLVVPWHDGSSGSGIKPMSPAGQADPLPLNHRGSSRPFL